MSATVTDDEMIEAMARAMLAANCERLAFPYPWDDLDDEGREQYRAEATAALDALRPLLARREAELREQVWRRACEAMREVAADGIKGDWTDDASWLAGFLRVLAFPPVQGGEP